MKTSSYHYLFNCNKCNHEFSISLSFIEHYDSFCNFCSDKRLCGEEDCEMCFNKSFASNPQSIKWSDKNELKPINYFKASHKSCLFNCDVCNHEYSTRLHDIHMNDAGCPFCAHKQICEISKNCSICFEASFGYHEMAKNWSKTNEISPFLVYKNSHKIFEFDCRKCNHTFSGVLSDITKGNNCNYCAHRKLCESPDCDFCYNVSFLSHHRSKFWSNKNIEKPRDVVKNSNEKYIFDCNKCKKEFKSRLGHVASGSWCPFCKNKTEEKLFKSLIPKYPSLIQQYKVDWSKYKRHLPYDFLIPEHKIIIELDGIQHFRQVGKWKSPEEIFKNDTYKEKCANDNGYSIIRILQEDVFKNSYDWLRELNESIHDIINSKEIMNIYICRNDEYTKFL